MAELQDLLDILAEHSMSWNDTIIVYESYQVLSMAVRIPATIFCCLVLFVGVAGNIIIVSDCGDHLKTSSVKYLTVCMALADLVLIIFGLPLEILYFNNFPWYLGRVGCKALSLLTQWSRFVWISCLLALTLVRHISDMVSESWYNVKQSAWCLVICVVCFSFAVPFAVAADTVDIEWGEDSSTHCVMAVDLNDILVSFRISFYVFSCSFIVLLSVLNGLFYYQGKPNSDPYLAFHLPVCMFIGYYVCTMPLNTHVMISLSAEANSDQHDDTNPWWTGTALVVATCLYYTSAVIQPLLSPKLHAVLRTIYKKTPENGVYV